MERPLRVLHVLKGMNRAGAETMLMNLHRHIDRNIVQFDFAECAKNKCDYDDEIIALGGRIIRYPEYKIINHFAYIKWWNDFFKKHHEYKIVHGHMGSTAPLYLAQAKRSGKITVVHAHSTKWRMHVPDFIYNLYSKNMQKFTDYFFGCSMLALEIRYGKKIAHDALKSKVFNNAVDAEKYVFNREIRDQVRRELDLNENDFVIGTVGRLTTPKNPHKIIEILLALKNHGVKFKFLWVGTGEMKAEVERSILEKGLNDDIKMLGLRSDVHRLLQAFDVFILPSLWEGLPVSVIEAQASGLPVLCSDRFEKESKITDLCEFLPLEDNKRWIDAIISKKNNIRRNTLNEIKLAGFDINSTAEWLQSFYINHAAAVAVTGGGGGSK